MTERVCKNCEHFESAAYSTRCVRGKTKVGIEPVFGMPIYKYTVNREAIDERYSILPWRCGKHGRYFEEKKEDVPF